jgi:SAM-dependent methyltransferase
VFVENGLEAQRFYEEVVKLDRSARILDIGSGIGRKTIPLLDYLEPDGRYVGLDIDRTLVSWCSNHITRRDPRFVFLHISVYNSFYNPDGALEPHDYRFPFADESFDAVALWSVFTHLLPDSITNYVNEISRMLRPDGTLIGSFFLINDESRQAITDGTTVFPALYNEGDYWTTNRNMPEHMVAVPEEWLHQQLDAAGLRATDVRLGTWTGTRQADDRFPNLAVQDVVIARPA